MIARQLTGVVVQAVQDSGGVRVLVGMLVGQQQFGGRVTLPFGGREPAATSHKCRCSTSCVPFCLGGSSVRIVRPVVALG